MSNHLYLYTLCFPHGRGEAFLEPEIEVLSNIFEKITIIPLSSSETIREMPKNVETIYIFEEYEIKESSLGKKMSLLKKAKINSRFLKDLRYQFSLITDLTNKTEVLSKFLVGKKGIHYSYWLDEWATILSSLKCRGEIQSFVSRVHGFDLYEERARLGYKPWRNFQLNEVQKIFAVSNSGQQYLEKKYPTFKSKISKSFLGTKDVGLGLKTENDVVNLLSCSSVIPLKRVPLIIDMLKHVHIRVNWTHIGGGVDLEKVEKLLENLPENISANLLGTQAHSDVLKFYKNNPVDCFINVSSTEGLPVSIMEAISFGVPVLATNVGGVSEIVNDKTGKLIDVKNPNAEFDIANAVEKFVQIVDEKNQLKDLSKSARKFWEQNFSAKKNYTEFGEVVIKICS